MLSSAALKKNSNSTNSTKSQQERQEICLDSKAFYQEEQRACGGSSRSICGGFVNNPGRTYYEDEEDTVSDVDFILDCAFHDLRELDVSYDSASLEEFEVEVRSALEQHFQDDDQDDDSLRSFQRNKDMAKQSPGMEPLLKLVPNDEEEDGIEVTGAGVLLARSMTTSTPPDPPLMMIHDEDDSVWDISALVESQANAKNTNKDEQQTLVNYGNEETILRSNKCVAASSSTLLRIATGAKEHLSPAIVSPVSEEEDSLLAHNKKMLESDPGKQERMSQRRRRRHRRRAARDPYQVVWEDNSIVSDTSWNLQQARKHPRPIFQRNGATTRQVHEEEELGEEDHIDESQRNDGETVKKANKSAASKESLSPLSRRVFAPNVTLSSQKGGKSSPHHGDAINCNVLMDPEPQLSHQRNRTEACGTTYQEEMKGDCDAAVYNQKVSPVSKPEATSSADSSPERMYWADQSRGAPTSSLPSSPSSLSDSYRIGRQKSQAHFRSHSTENERTRTALGPLMVANCRRTALGPLMVTKCRRRRRKDPPAKRLVTSEDIDEDLFVRHHQNVHNWRHNLDASQGGILLQDAFSEEGKEKVMPPSEKGAQKPSLHLNFETEQHLAIDPALAPLSAASTSADYERKHVAGIEYKTDVLGNLNVGRLQALIKERTDMQERHSLAMKELSLKQADSLLGPTTETHCGVVTETLPTRRGRALLQKMERRRQCVEITWQREEEQSCQRQEHLQILEERELHEHSTLSETEEKELSDSVVVVSPSQNFINDATAQVVHEVESLLRQSLREPTSLFQGTVEEEEEARLEAFLTLGEKSGTSLDERYLSVDDTSSDPSMATRPSWSSKEPRGRRLASMRNYHKPKALHESMDSAIESEETLKTGTLSRALFRSPTKKPQLISIKKKKKNIAKEVLANYVALVDDQSANASFPRSSPCDHIQTEEFLTDFAPPSPESPIRNFTCNVEDEVEQERSMPSLAAESDIAVLNEMAACDLSNDDGTIFVFGNDTDGSNSQSSNGPEEEVGGINIKDLVPVETTICSNNKQKKGSPTSVSGFFDNFDAFGHSSRHVRETSNIAWPVFFDRFPSENITLKTPNFPSYGLSVTSQEDEENFPHRFEI